jgi:hypothetical protein
MRRDWNWGSDRILDPGNRIELWWLTRPARLGFAVLLKSFEIDSRFPEHAAEVPDAVPRGH